MSFLNWGKAVRKSVVVTVQPRPLAEVTVQTPMALLPNRPNKYSQFDINELHAMAHRLFGDDYCPKWSRDKLERMLNEADVVLKGRPA